MSVIFPITSKGQAIQDHYLWSGVWVRLCLWSDRQSQVLPLHFYIDIREIILTSQHTRFTRKTNRMFRSCLLLELCVTLTDCTATLIQLLDCWKLRFKSLVLASIEYVQLYGQAEEML